MPCTPAEGVKGFFKGLHHEIKGPFLVSFERSRYVPLMYLRGSLFGMRYDTVSNILVFRSD
jgi:hypothetical protein